MIYTSFSSDEIECCDPALVEVYLEINHDGYVMREVGLGQNQTIIYFSDNYSPSRSALFDIALIDLKSIRDRLSSTQFEEIWQKATS